MTTKQCPACNKIKLLEEFESRRRQCRACRRAYQRRLRHVRRDHFRAKNKRNKISSKYGLSADDYNRLLEKQNNRCASCYRRDSLCVDHDHQTGRVRGLLCRMCNFALGHARDDLAILRNLITYLETHRHNEEKSTTS